MSPRPGMVRLVPTGGLSPLTLIVNAPPSTSLGVGGWQSSARPLRKPARWWESELADTLGLDLLLDVDAIGGPSVERRLEVLAAMGRPVGTGTPPRIRLEGDVPCARTQEWIMEGEIALGDRLFLPTGALRRQQVQITLEEYLPVPSIKRVAVNRTRRSPTAKRRRRVVRARKGDTIRAIAVRELGRSSDWPDIRTWNPKLRKIGPDVPLGTGTQVVLR